VQDDEGDGGRYGPGDADAAAGTAESRKTGLDRAMQATLLPSLRALSVFFAFLSVAHLVVLPRPAAWAMGALAFVTAVTFSAAFARLQRKPLQPAMAHLAAAATASAVLANCLAHLALIGDATDTTNLLIFIAGAGFLLLSRAWLLAMIAVSWVGWIAVARLHDGEPWSRFVFGLIAASTLGILVHVVRVRTIVRLESLTADLETRVRERTRELEASNQLLRTVIDRLPDAICIKDDRGALRFANEAAVGLRSGAGGRSIVGLRNADVWPATEVAREDAEDADVLATGTPVIERLVTLPGAHGTPRRFVVSKYVLHDGGGGATGLLDVRRDVTEALRQQEARLDMEQRMQHVQKLQSLGVLTGGIAHDFNNLLTGVMGAASLARLHAADAAKVAVHLQQIESSAQQAADLCKQLLAYAGRGRLLIERADLNTLVRESLPLLRLSASRHITMHLALRPGALLFDGDPSQIRQVVINLVINAAEALGDRPDGRVTLTSGLLEANDTFRSDPMVGVDLAPGLYGYIEVTDNGCGMARDVVARIFEPFYTTKFTGRGLGLAVVLGIARSHRGTVTVESTLDAGSTFRVLIPLALDDVAPRPSPSRGDDQAISFEGDVLLIDDEPVVREVVGEMLQRLGLRPAMAENGVEGLEAFARAPRRYRLVVVDLTMPTAGGAEVLRGVRAVRPDTPVLLISGYSEADIVLPADGDAPVAFLQKPFSVGSLRRSVAALLQDG
jgi:two-component system cell cycle sensor histidine kinase/response regulator CckA